MSGDPRSILITGCASGIGRHAALALHQRGWKVIATCRQAGDCAGLEAHGLTALHLDLADAGTIRTAFARATEITGGRLDALFNNGAHALAGAIEDTPTDAFRAIFEANFMGWHELVRLALPVMRRQRHGRIVQCSSVLGFVGLRMRGAYVTTKFAVEGYTDVLRLELRGTGIHPILLSPGPITSRLRANARPHYERWVERENTPWAGFYRQTLEPRLYAPEDAPPDRFELSPAATTAKLIRALEAPRPRARYFVTTPTYAAWYLKRFLPVGWLDRILHGS